MSDPQPDAAQPVPPWWTDPTKNVISLVDAAMQRQDDLRERDNSHAREMRETARMYEGRIAEKDKEIRQAETDRINAIRAVDVGAAAILANQVAASAEALRGQVEAARQQTATALAAALEPIQKDIRDLRDAQSRGQGGKEQVVETRDVRAESRQGTSVNLTAISVLFGVIIVALALYAALHK